MSLCSRQVFAALALSFSVLLAAPHHATAAQCESQDITKHVQGQGYCLVVETISANPGGPLIVILHGDVSRGGPATYHFELARDVAAAQPVATVVAMLRPGYDNGRGQKSDGHTNNRRDHYTARNIDSVAAAIENLRTHYRAERVALIGHSGGAAFTGVIAGRQPGLVDRAVVISCPCDIVRWRQSRRSGSVWPMSLSPSDYVDGVAPTTRVLAITGARDSNTRSEFAQDYIAALRSKGRDAVFYEVPDMKHGLSSAAIETLMPRLTAFLDD